MSRILQVSELGQPILRQQAPDVERIDDPEVQELVDDMIATVKHVDGVGIAAPQVFRSQNLFIIASYPNQRYPQAPLVEPFALFNARLLHQGEELDGIYEACLSIPGIRAWVPRSTHIEVEYYDRHGKHIRCEYKDFLARIFQHEYDHVCGKVYVDRVQDTTTMMTETEFRRMLNQQQELKS